MGREADEVLKVDKFLDALNDLEVHRFVLLNDPTTWIEAVCPAQADGTQEKLSGIGVAETGAKDVHSAVDTNNLARQSVEPEIAKLRQDVFQTKKDNVEKPTSTSMAYQNGSKSTKCATKVAKKKSVRC